MKIDIMIAGAQKAATSSLKYYLSQHPKISTHFNLECDYFSSDACSFNEYFSKYFEPENQVILAKYAMLYKEDIFVEKLYQHNPDCIIIFILREPVERLISNYEMEKKSWVDFPPEHFIDVLKMHRNGEYHVVYNTLIKLGDYGLAAETLLKYFPQKNIHFVSFNELKKYPDKICRNIFQLLEIQDSPNLDFKRKNVGHTNRSYWFSRLLLWLKKSPLKKGIKAMLPYRTFLRLSNNIEQLNKVELNRYEEKTTWENHVLHVLNKHYQQCNQKFKQVTGIDTENFF